MSRAELWNSISNSEEDLTLFAKCWIFSSNFRIELVSTKRTFRKICWLVSSRTVLNKQKLQAIFYLIWKMSILIKFFGLSFRSSWYQSLTLPISEIDDLSLVVVRAKPLFWWTSKGKLIFVRKWILTSLQTWLHPHSRKRSSILIKLLWCPLPGPQATGLSRRHWPDSGHRRIDAAPKQ